MPNIRIITSVIGRAQRGIGRAQLNIGRASALPGLYKTTPVYALGVTAERLYLNTWLSCTGAAAKPATDRPVIHTDPRPVAISQQLRCEL